MNLRKLNLRIKLNACGRTKLNCSNWSRHWLIKSISSNWCKTRINNRLSRANTIRWTTCSYSKYLTLRTIKCTTCINVIFIRINNWISWISWVSRKRWISWINKCINIRGINRISRIKPIRISYNWLIKNVIVIIIIRNLNPKSLWIRIRIDVNWIRRITFWSIIRFLNSSIFFSIIRIIIVRIKFWSQWTLN